MPMRWVSQKLEECVHDSAAGHLTSAMGIGVQRQHYTVSRENLDRFGIISLQRLGFMFEASDLSSIHHACVLK